MNLEGQNLDQKVAEVFFQFSQFGCYGSNHLIGLRGGKYEPVPYFSATLDGARRVEDEVEARGLQNAYVRYLIEECDLDTQVFSSAIECNPYTSSDGLTVLWKLIRATPEQRCLAALRAANP